MEVLTHPVSGAYQTNCYLIDRKIVVDPGEGAYQWLKRLGVKPIAILNTHGHLDHIWDNHLIQREWKTPIYIHRNDSFFLTLPQFGITPPPTTPDVLMEEGSYQIDEYRIKVHHFPGHTPGEVAFEIGGALFTGDFLFKGSIGRTDFPYSNPRQMIDSLQKFLRFSRNLKIYPGHGEPSDVATEKGNIPFWIELLENEEIR
jgi:glyoxylase-like metal-dependent hydrolase (beta-lactamase superfamily II)